MESVTILIPNHNERLLWRTIAGLRGVLPAQQLIFVSDDPDGRGVGWALREGLRRVETPWVIFVMADGSEDPVCIARMVRMCTATYDAVWGDRWEIGSVFGYPWFKWIGNRFGNQLIAWLLRSDYTDWTDLAKAYRTDGLRRISWSDDFRCEVEIPIRYWRSSSQLASRLAIVPMHWTERSIGRSSFRLWRAGQTLWTLLKVWREA
jgi:glycosyltransferase involved in cell wall biosynthesis